MRTLVENGWQPGPKSTFETGVAEIGSHQAKSAPSALEVLVVTLYKHDVGSFFVRRSLEKSATKRVVLSFDLYSNQIRIVAQGGRLDVDLVESTSSGTIDAPAYAFPAELVVKQWHRFVLTVDREHDTLGLVIDDALGTSATKTFHVPQGPTAGLTLDLGAQIDQTDETVNLFFDNVTLDLDR